MQGWIERYAFSVHIYTKKLVQGVRLYEIYNDIVVGVHSNKLISVSSINIEELQYSCDAVRSKGEKSDLAYELKVPVLSIQIVQVEKSPYIVITGHTEEKNESNKFGTDFLHELASVCYSMKGIFVMDSM